ncbi:MAG TPA: GNAT family N-acetyltransferase [Acidimicrobiales bacterium]|nr:GNAT family N-acetyltransferase [Acidimicrobiales bacterium]
MTERERSVRVRPADEDDVDQLAAVELHTALTAYAPIFPPDAPTPTHDEFVERWRARLTREPVGSAVFGAFDGDTLVGLVMGDPAPELDPDPEHHGHLRALYVRPDHWGQGIGRRLHDTAVEYLRIARPQLQPLTLWVMERNTRARASYERWGWEVTEDRQEIWPGIDELRYERMLR